MHWGEKKKIEWKNGCLILKVARALLCMSYTFLRLNFVLFVAPLMSLPLWESENKTNPTFPFWSVWDITAVEAALMNVG